MSSKKNDKKGKKTDKDKEKEKMDQEEAKREFERQEAQKRSNLFLNHSSSFIKIWNIRCLWIFPQSHLQKRFAWSQHLWICRSAGFEVSEKNETTGRQERIVKKF